MDSPVPFGLTESSSLSAREDNADDYGPGPDVSANGPADAAEALCDKLLSETRDELVRADSKAFAFFSLFGVVTAVLLSQIVRGNWNPTELDAAAAAVFWMGFLLIFFAVGCLGGAVWPRVGGNATSPGGARASYFGDLRKDWTVAELKEALVRTAGDGLDLKLAKLLSLSRIVRRKFLLIRWALVLFLVGIILCALAVLVHALG
jgi:hypothetical protein